MVSPTARTVYIAASANRYSNVSDCRDQDGLVAFGSGHFVALWDSASPVSAGIHATLPGHLGDVTVLKFLPSSTASSFFVSGDNTGVARVWKESGNNWTTFAVLDRHSSSVSSLAAMSLPNRVGGDVNFLVLTGSSDGSVHSWHISDSGAVLLQKFDLKGKLPLEMAMSYLPASESIALAIGSTENRISIFTTATSGPAHFSKSLSLEGHSDWVRSLTFTTPIPVTASLSSASSHGYDIQPGEVLLASGSQDNYIRLWRFTRISQQPLPSSSIAVVGTGLDALDEFERTLAEAGDGELRVKAHEFQIEGDGVFSCSSEAVLLGHDAWITGLHWAPANSSSKLRLLSSSADRSMIIWTPSSDGSTSASSSIWASSRRFGEFTSATNLGFFGALWGKNARGVLAHGWGGSWHVWKQEQRERVEEFDPETAEWEAVVAVGGHFGMAKTLVWEPEGEFLISAGMDMTTRLHAPWKRTIDDGRTLETWHELGRPQIHGYPIVSLSFTNRLQFVSGADEKIVRVFDAPKVFLSSLSKLSGVDGLGDLESRPMAANVPPLGLSNRAIATPAEAEQLAPASKDPFDQILPVNFTVASHPPFEEQLLGSTLWPEIEKLYGHGYEIIALASAHRSSLIATVCKATSPEHAVIRLYDSETWKPYGSILEGHALTITSLKFSADDRWLLSVSRDRSWRLFEKVEGGYKASSSSKAHSRIIWDACWAPNDSFFATASRDKTVKIWTQGQSGWDCAATLKFDESVTALASTSILDPPRSLVAVGLENGHIHLFTSLPSDDTTWSPYLVIDSSVAHVLAVTALQFRPRKDGQLELASASEDRSVRVIKIE